MLNELKTISSTKKELKDFGLLVGGVCLLLSIYIYFRKHYVSPLIPIGIILMVLGALKPSFLKYVYIAWMAFALTIGWFMTRIILFVVFVLVVIPIKIVLQISGSQLVDTKINKKAKTYWIYRQPSKDYVTMLEKQF